jgi:hypothetical protein
MERAMHVVVGGWEMDPSQAGDRRATLEGIVSNVKQIPGLVKGYWTGGPMQERSYTFIVFSERTQAEAFAADVRGNAEKQASNGVRNLSLDVHEIVAQT